jgi:hypothetical protein
MSYDITIMDEAGYPTVNVPLYDDEHWTLIQQAKQLDLPMWSRMSDYYEDADYSVEELTVFAAETAHLRSR